MTWGGLMLLSTVKQSITKHQIWNVLLRVA
ncbi:UNVERIFIED_CONTAM: hypothetical protein GTU68_062646 [Idotea baltica]|nr:hypothetical protein [Idotea baltica]